MQAISQPGDRRADDAQGLRALGRAGPPAGLQQEEEAVLRQGHLELLDAAQRDPDEIPGRDLEGRQLFVRGLRRRRPSHRVSIPRDRRAQR